MMQGVDAVAKDAVTVDATDALELGAADKALADQPAEQE
jgi:hypothetical protein